MASHIKVTPVPAGFLSKSTPNLSISSPAEAALEPKSQLVASPPRKTTRSKEDSQSNNPLSGIALVEKHENDYEEPFVSEEAGNESSEEEVVQPAQSRPVHLSRSHSHLPRHTANSLFPPFYNRPPTPLPPSPSLKSLLRPSFSTTTSRPTTPDSSDVDNCRQRPSFMRSTSEPKSSTTKLANSARHAPTIPRASPKVPTYEYYGFAVYLGSSAAFLMYILWAYAPAPMLHQMGIHYYPNRWWALAIPCWLVALVIYIYVALAGYNTRYLTLPLDSIENLIDECAQVAVVDPKTSKIVRNPVLVADKLLQKDKEKAASAGKINKIGNDFPSYQFRPEDSVDWKDLWSIGTDAALDVPIGGVCEILYGD